MSKKDAIRVRVNAPSGQEIVSAALQPKAGTTTEQCTIASLWAVMAKTYPKELQGVSMTTWQARRLGKVIKGDFTESGEVYLHRGDRVVIETENMP